MQTNVTGTKRRGCSAPQCNVHLLQFSIRGGFSAYLHGNNPVPGACGWYGEPVVQVTDGSDPAQGCWAGLSPCRQEELGWMDGPSQRCWRLRPTQLLFRDCAQSFRAVNSSRMLPAPRGCSVLSQGGCPQLRWAGDSAGTQRVWPEGQQGVPCPPWGLAEPPRAAMPMLLGPVAVLLSGYTGGGCHLLPAGAR